MDERDSQDEGVLDKARDAVSNVFGGTAADAAANTPEVAGEDMGMNQHQLQDIGMSVPDVQSAPYGDSAGSHAAPDNPIPGPTSSSD